MAKNPKFLKNLLTTASMLAVVAGGVNSAAAAAAAAAAVAAPAATTGVADNQRGIGKAGAQLNDGDGLNQDGVAANSAFVDAQSLTDGAIGATAITNGRGVTTISAFRVVNNNVQLISNRAGDQVFLGSVVGVGGNRLAVSISNHNTLRLFGSNNTAFAITHLVGAFDAGWNVYTGLGPINFNNGNSLFIIDNSDLLDANDGAGATAAALGMTDLDNAVNNQGNTILQVMNGLTIRDASMLGFKGIELGGVNAAGNDLPVKFLISMNGGVDIRAAGLRPFNFKNVESELIINPLDNNPVPFTTGTLGGTLNGVNRDDSGIITLQLSANDFQLSGAAPGNTIGVDAGNRARLLKIVNGGNVGNIVTIDRAVFAKKITADAGGDITFAAAVDSGADGLIELTGARNITFGHNATIGNSNSARNGLNGAALVAGAGPAGAGGNEFAGINTAGFNSDIVFADNKASVANIFSKGGVVNVSFAGAAAGTSFAGDIVNSYNGAVGAAANTLTLTLPDRAAAAGGLINYAGNAISAARVGGAAAAQLDPQFVKVIFGANGGTYSGNLVNATLSAPAGANVDITQPNHIGQLISTGGGGRYVLPNNFKLRGNVDTTGHLKNLQFTGAGEIAGQVVAGVITNDAVGIVKLGVGAAGLDAAAAAVLGINGDVPAVAAANVAATSITVSKAGQSYELGAKYTGKLIFDGTAAGQNTDDGSISVAQGINPGGNNTFTTGGTIAVAAGGDANATTFANKAGSTATYRVTGDAGKATFNNSGVAAGGAVAAVAGGAVNYEVTGNVGDLDFGAAVAGVNPGATSVKVSGNTGVVTFNRDEAVKLTSNADHRVDSVVVAGAVDNVGTIDASEAQAGKTLTFTNAVGNAAGGGAKKVKMIDVSGGSNVTFSDTAYATIKVKNDNAAVVPVISLTNQKVYDLELVGNAAGEAIVSAPKLKVGAGANQIIATINTPKLTSIDYDQAGGPSNELVLEITNDLTTKLENYRDTAGLSVSSDKAGTQRTLTLSSIEGNAAASRFGGIGADENGTIVLPAAKLYFAGSGVVAGKFIALGLFDPTAKIVISGDVDHNGGAAAANRFAIASVDLAAGPAFVDGNGTAEFRNQNAIILQGNIGAAIDKRVGSLKLTQGDVAVDDASSVFTKKVEFELVDDVVNPTLDVKASDWSALAGANTLVVTTNKVGKGNIKINHDLTINDQFIIGTAANPIGFVKADATVAGGAAAGARTITVSTANFYGSVGTAADNTNNAVITKVGSLQNIGAKNLAFSKVTIDASVTVNELHSRVTEVKAGKVLTIARATLGGANDFVGAINLEAGAAAAAAGAAATAGGKLVLSAGAILGNDVVGTAVAAPVVPRGTVEVGAGAEVLHDITLVDSVTFTGGAQNIQTMLNGVTIDNPTLNAGYYKVTAPTTFNNATLTANTNLTLGKKLTLNGATVSGLVTATAVYDGTNVGALEATAAVNAANGSINIVLDDQSGITELSAARRVQAVNGINLITAGKVTGSVAKSTNFLTYEFDAATGSFNPKDNTTAASENFVADAGKLGFSITTEEFAAVLKSSVGTEFKQSAQKDVAQTATAVDKLTDDSAPTVTTTVVNNIVSATTDVMNNRMFDVAVTPSVGMDSKVVSQAGATGVAAGDGEAGRYGLWFMPFYNQGRQKMLKSVSGYKSEGTGGTIGFDTMANDTMTVGLAATYVQSDVKFKDTLKGDKTKVQTLMFSIYGVQEFAGNWFAQGVASFGSSKVKGKAARIGFSNNAVTNLTAHSKYDVMSYGGEVQLGYNYKFADNVLFTPTFGLSYNKFNDSGYTETNAGNQNRTIGKKSTDKVEVLAGARVAMTTDMNGMAFTPDLHVNVRQSLTNKSPKVDVRLSGSTDPLPTSSTKPSKTLFNVGLGLNMKNGMMEYGLGADAYMAKKYTGYQGSLKVRVNF